MKHSLRKMLSKYSVAGSLLLLGSNALAGGPLAVCNPGEPFLWPGGGSNIPYNPDQGALGVLDNAAATAAVTDAFQAWADVSTATATYSNNGALPVDVDITNFVPFLQPAAPDGLSAIVFDDTGEIFDAVFGPGSGILGFAGPEWINGADCTITEGVSFLNGPAIGTLEGLLDLMVHEFGHYSNLAHSEVNGQLFIGVGDTSGPGSDATFGPPPFPDPADIIETMYPFLFGGIDQRARTPHRDDQASLSRLYPSADFAATTGTITGSILLGANGATGINVIARNVDNPFEDAVSAISSDYTDDFSPDSPFTGLYTLSNLTPGANYAIYTDEILDGGFSTPLSSPLPGPEEFYNGANESSDPFTDIPNEFVPVAAIAGSPQTGIDILVNLPPPNVPLPITDDGTVQIPLPFQFCFAGQAYGTAFINGNGFITLDAPDTSGLSFLESESAFVSGAPRIAGLWDDLNVEDGGSIIYQSSGSEFSVTWSDVPEFSIGGANSFTITLRKNSHRCLNASDIGGHGPKNGSGGDISISFGELSAIDGLSGVSAGSYATSGFEAEIDLVSEMGRDNKFSLKHTAAVFELFNEAPNDLANAELRFNNLGSEYKDRFEKNDSLKKARKIDLPFDTIDTRRAFSSISPGAADIDYYRFNERLEAGTTLVAEVLTGQIDSVLGLYLCDFGPAGTKSDKCDPSTAILVAADDDGGNNLLSRIQFPIPVDGTYALAVTFCCDFDFDGVDPGQGAPFDQGRYVLDAFVVPGLLLPLTDESTIELGFGFDFPYQGNTYSSVFVNSNGYLTFGDGEIFAFTPNVPDFENGLPRVAPLWVDLDPGADGFILANGDGSSVTIDFVGVPEFFFGGSNTFSVTLDASGGVYMSYSGLTAPEGLTGLAEGGGAASTPADLSTSPTWSATGSTHELFDFIASPFDLDGSVLIWQP